MTSWRTLLRVEEAGHDMNGEAVWELFDMLIWRTHVVPIGFRTNYASVPRLPLIFLLAGGRAHKEATLHDFYYTVRSIPREEADRLFLEALLENPRIPRRLAHAMYYAVRWFGQSPWNNDTNVLQLPRIQALIRPKEQS